MYRRSVYATHHHHHHHHHQPSSLLCSTSNPLLLLQRKITFFVGHHISSLFGANLNAKHKHPMENKQKKSALQVKSFLCLCLGFCFISCCFFLFWMLNYGIDGLFCGIVCLVLRITSDPPRALYMRRCLSWLGQQLWSWILSPRSVPGCHRPSS